MSSPWRCPRAAESGELGAHGAEIKALEDDIKDNLESQREARGLREKQNVDYEGEKTESEQCIGALEAAVKVLTKGTSSGFLETMKEVELLSVVAGVRSALQRPTVSKTMSSTDLSLIRNFIEHPADFVGKRAGSLSAVQIANNPFGDYAPQSTQIQGILKGMYDAFTQDLEKDNVAEAESQKAFEELMATKKQELETLQESLQQQQKDNARKTEERATAREELADTNTQLDADEAFFDTTKAGCKEKANQWSIRSGLRAQELGGVNEAIKILTSKDASNTFTKSTSTFLQVASKRNAAGARLVASAKLARVAQRYNSLSLAKVALEVKSGGHFDKVIASIDEMIASVRKEEQEDIEHRDRCERAQDKNANDKADMDSAIAKAKGNIEKLEEEERSLEGKISEYKGQIKATKTEMEEALGLRNDAVADFKQALKDDYDAVALLEQTIVALNRFYKKNKIPISLSQAEPEYTVDEDKAPETSWTNEKYGGRNDETHGIVEIIRMLKEDVEKEIKTGRADNAQAEAQYEKEKSELQDSLDSQQNLKDTAERQLAEVLAAIHGENKEKTAQTKDLAAENGLEKSIGDDCAWVKSHFDSRRTKRKAEIEGLIDAKGYLAGSEDGSLI